MIRVFRSSMIFRTPSSIRVASMNPSMKKSTIHLPYSQRNQQVNTKAPIAVKTKTLVATTGSSTIPRNGSRNLIGSNPLEIGSSNHDGWRVALWRILKEDDVRRVVYLVEMMIPNHLSSRSIKVIVSGIANLDTVKDRE